MKKYKLVREYPGSPKLGTKIISLQAYNDIDKDHIYYTNSIYNFKANIIENQSEYWQEIIEKEYEILSLKYDNNIYKYQDKNNEFQFWFHPERVFKGQNGYVNLKDNFSTNSVDIHSIKRLSDDEIFTIGDNISERISNNKEFLIESFNIYFDKLCISIKKGSTHTTASLSLLNKLRKSLFTTEDGFNKIDLLTKEYKNKLEKIINEANIQLQ